jgi:polygalacturonase
VVAPASAATGPDFPYGGAEVTRWYNLRTDPNITLPQGRVLAHYFNGLVVSYLRAVQRAQQASDLIWHWQGVADCESGDNIYAVSSSGSYAGWLQFDQQSWSANGGSGSPYGQPRATAARVAENYRLRSGTSPWPICGRYYR